MATAKKSTWTLEACLQDASQYQHISEWIKSNQSAYNAAYRYGWIGQCTAHMTQKTKWSLETCLQDASQYQHKSEWKKGNSSAYQTAHKNGWIDQCTEHMTRKARPTIQTLEFCIKDASQYSYKSEWKKANPSAYQAARKYGWLDQCTAHMKPMRPNWTLEDCVKDASLYRHKSEWKKSNQNAYSAAQRYGWFEQCSKHMTPKSKPKSKWSLEFCLQDASQYQHKSEWLNGNKSAYTAAYRYGWLDQCTEHMTNKPR